MATRTRSPSGARRWAFTRVGGVDQVLLRDGADIEKLPELDQKLWAALAMPKKAAGVLPETLDALDGDGDGRIRAPDVVAAIRFCARALTSLDAFVEAGESLEVSGLEPGPLADAAAWVLQADGKAGAPQFTLVDARGGAARLAANRFNGDGILPASSAEDPTLCAPIADVVAAGYGAADFGGEAGVSAAGLESFLAAARAWLDWRREPASLEALLPMGDSTGAAWSALEAVRAKVDDYFLRSSLARMSGTQGLAALGQDARLAALLSSDIRIDSPELLELPLAAPSTDATLSLSGPLNPAWSAGLRAFVDAAAPLLGHSASRLDASSWERAKSLLAPYGAWAGRRPAGGIGSLGEERLAAIVAGGDCARLAKLITEDSAWAGKRQHLADLVKLLLLRRDLLRMLRNFVNFSDLYGKRDAVFQAGRLYLDGRECDLCMEVDHPAAHAPLAVMSGVYLIYCECSRAGAGQRSVVAALTAGEAGNLFVGKNGVFYDRDGLDWDARVSRIQDQPISIREAFFSPYRWLARTIEDLVARRAAAAESGRQGKLNSQAESAVATVADAGAAKAGAGLDVPKKIDVGTVAAIGVALGSIGAMVTGVLSAFVGMGVWMPVGLASIFLLISGPSMLLAYMKLRRRNLGPILDAEGWAINGRLMINVPFGNALTRLAALPPGSEHRFQDPFAERRRPWGLYLLVLAVLALALLWVTGVLDPLLPETIRLKSLLGPG